MAKVAAASACLHDGPRLRPSGHLTPPLDSGLSGRAARGHAPDYRPELQRLTTAVEQLARELASSSATLAQLVSSGPAAGHRPLASVSAQPPAVVPAWSAVHVNGGANRFLATEGAGSPPAEEAIRLLRMASCRERGTGADAWFP